MYKLIQDGSVLGLVDEPRYVKLNNGVFIQCPMEEADGVAFNSQFYRFSFKEMEGYGPIDVQPVDSGEYILSHENKITVLDQGLTETQLALVETYESGLSSGEEITALQLAITEVYEMMLETGG